MSDKVVNLGSKTANGLDIGVDGKVREIKSLGDFSVNFEEKNSNRVILTLGSVRFNVPVKEFFKLENKINQISSEIRQSNVVLTGVPHA